MLKPVPATLILLCLASPAGGATEDRRPLTVDVQLGLGGCYWEKASFPVLIAFSSETGAAFRGRAAADLESVDSCSGEISPLRSYSCRFEIPAGKVRQQITLPAITSPASSQISISIEDAVSGDTIHKRTFTLKPLKRRAALILTTDPSRFDILGSLKDDVKTVPVKPEDLPDNPHLYAGFSALILDDVPFRSIPPEAREAMLNAPNEGLKLVFTERCLKINAEDPDFQSLWRVRVKGRFEIRSPDNLLTFLRMMDVTIAPLSGADVELAEEQVYLREEGHPLIGSWAIGLGWMLLITFDPADLAAVPAEKTYEIRQRLWEWLLHAGHEGDPIRWNSSYTIPPSARLSHLKKYFFAYLAVAVLLVLGPLNFFILKKFERREYILVSIPLVVVLLGCVPYLIGRIVRGGVPTLKTVSVEFGKGKETRAVSRRYVGLLAADGREHRLGVTGGSVFPVDLIQAASYYREDVGKFPIAVEFAPEETIVANIRTPLWTMRFFRLDRFIHYPGALDHRIELDSRGNFLEGSLANGLGFELKDAGIVFRHRHVSLGDIPPGGTADFRFPTGVSLSPSCPPGGDCRPGKNPFAPYLWEGGPFTREELKVLSDAFGNFEALFRYPVLFARRTPETETLNVNRRGARRGRTDFVFFTLPPRFETLDIPYGIASRSLARGDEDVFYSGAFIADDDEILVNYFLSVHAPDPVAVDELKVNLQAEWQASRPLLILQAYDWQSDAWVEVASIREEKTVISLPDPGRFVFLPGGNISLKLKTRWGEGQKRGRLRLPVFDVSFKGHRQDG